MKLAMYSVLYFLKNSTQRKHIFRWLLSFKKGYLMRKRQPWLVFDAIDYLDSLPLNGKRVFEYGSGGSTLYWLSRNMVCVSVEHDPSWFNFVHTHLQASSKIDYRLITPQRLISSKSPDVSDPLLYLSDDINFIGHNFKNYASQIDDFSNEYFDVVLIDGRARPSCIMHSISKVKINGLLVLDNADRVYYTESIRHLFCNYICLPFYGVGPTGYQMWQTNIYVRKQ